MRTKLMAVAVIAALPMQAIAGTAMLPQPFQVGEETARFDQGVPTVSLEQKAGAVQITPLYMDHGSVAFTIVVYNDGTTPANFDVSNIEAEAGGQKLAAMTSDRLESAAKSRALWSQIGVAMLAGVAAAAVSSAHSTDTYRSRLRTPHGTYSWVSSYRDNSIGVLGATAAVGAGAYGISTIQQRLDATLAQINDQVVQRTTVDPEESYGGRVVLEKVKAKGNPREVRIAVNWNGVVYRFGLHIPKKGEIYNTSVRAAAAPSRAARIGSPAPTPEPAAITPVGSPANAPLPPAATPTPPLPTTTT